MSDWIDFFIYATLVVTYWFVFATKSSQYTVAMVADRNPDWLAAHPEVASQLTGSRWFLWSCYAWGALSLGVLLAYQMGVWPPAFPPSSTKTERWEALKDINGSLLIIGLVFFFGCVGFFTRRLRDVPLAERRTASLERRSLDGFIPRWFQTSAYGLVGIHIAAWLVVGACGLYSTPAFWGRFVTLFVLSVVFFFFARVSVTRPPMALDRVFGAGYRRGEVHFAFAMEVGTTAVYAVLLYQEVANTIILSDRAIHLGLVLVIVCGILRFTLFPTRRATPSQL